MAKKDKKPIVNWFSRTKKVTRTDSTGSDGFKSTSYTKEVSAPASKLGGPAMKKKVVTYSGRKKALSSYDATSSSDSSYSVRTKSKGDKKFKESRGQYAYSYNRLNDTTGSFRDSSKFSDTTYRAPSKRLAGKSTSSSSGFSSSAKASVYPKYNMKGEVFDSTYKEDFKPVVKNKVKIPKKK